MRLTSRLILVSLILFTAIVFIFTVVPPCIGNCLEDHQGILNGTAPSPNRYRVLYPYSLNAFVPASSTDELTYLTASALSSVGLIALYLFFFYSYMHRLFDPYRSLLGTILMAVCLPPMFNAIWPLWDAWGLVEANLMLLAGFILLKQGFAWRWQLLGLLALACLNRETGGLIALWYIASRWRNEPLKQWLTWSAVYVAVTLGIFFALRFWLGTAPESTPFFSGTWMLLNEEFTELLYWNLGVIPLVLIIIMNYRHCPPMIQRGLWVVLAYFVILLAKARISEIGLWLPVMPLVMSALLVRLSPIMLESEQTA